MRSKSESTRRRLQPADRRDEILAAAIVALRTHGRTCTVAHVTTEADTAKGNFYRYFASWDQLLDAVRDHLLDDYRRRLEQRLTDAQPVDWWQLLAHEIRNYIDFQVELGIVHDIVFHRPGAAETTNKRGADQILESLLVAGADDGTFRATDTETMATLLFHTLHGAADEISHGADRSRTETGVIELFSAVLTKP